LANYIREIMEEKFIPCYRVDRESYRAVLREIIETWSRSGKGVSFYDLYKKKVVRSKSGLNTILKVLTGCGYVMCKESEPETKSPKGRKDYYPTPLGILMNTVLTLHYPEELGIKEKSLAYFIASAVLGAILSYGKLKEIYDCTIIIVKENPDSISCMRTSEDMEFIEGYANAIQAVELLFLNDLEEIKEILLSSLPNWKNSLLEMTRSKLIEDLKFLETKEKEMEKVIVKGSVQERVSYKVVSYLRNSYDLLIKSLSVHEKHESTT
jgi:hypothetical protein